MQRLPNRLERAEESPLPPTRPYTCTAASWTLTLGKRRVSPLGRSIAGTGLITHQWIAACVNTALKLTPCHRLKIDPPPGATVTQRRQ
jgi:hypothetical protein